jgi:hypothetical protein
MEGLLAADSWNTTCGPPDNERECDVMVLISCVYVSYE